LFHPVGVLEVRRSMTVSSISGLCGAMPLAAVRAALRVARRESQEVMGEGIKRLGY
jgi:hypothetical protein